MQGMIEMEQSPAPSNAAPACCCSSGVKCATRRPPKEVHQTLRKLAMVPLKLLIVGLLLTANKRRVIPPSPILAHSLRCPRIPRIPLSEARSTFP